MLKRFLTISFLVVAVLGVTSGADAQYLRITTDNPTDNTRLRATGTTILTITLDTNHDKIGTVQSCNSHTSANCGAVATAQPLDMFSYTLAFKAVGGTVTWGTFSASDASYTDTSPQIQSDTEVEINKSRPTGTFTPPGLATVGTLPVTIATLSPRIDVQIGASTINPFGFGTAFGTECDGFFFPNTYVVGNPTDPCGATTGIPGDWFDWDGAKPPTGGNNAPSISAPTSATATEGTAMSPITATATDLDAADVLTITQSGMPADLVFTHTPGPSPRTATISGTPGFSDAGTYPITWTVSDGHGGTASANTSLTVTNTNRAPTLAQPANMVVNEGTSADQVLSGNDPDGDALTFTLVSGPSYVNVTTLTPTTGNARVAPGFNDSGTATATVRATDTGTLNDQKSFSITVNNVDRPVVLAAISNMSVTAGSTADQTFTATDPDGDAITFTHTGPTFMTRTDNAQAGNTRTGNIHLAPPTTANGTFSATVTATANGATSPRTFTITVTGGNTPPVLAQPANMTVNEGQTANQTLTATDADGQALTFTKAAGPTYATVTTTTPGTGTGTGNLALAPGFNDSGTATVSVSVSDGAGGTNSKSLTVTVNNVDRPVSLAAINNMTVVAGSTADQTFTATDPDGDAITFTNTGPTFLTRTDNAQAGTTRTGNIHLAPSSTTSGTFSASVTASSLTSSDTKLFTITVTGVNNPPTLAQPANMTVNEGATANQTITATDPDGNPLTFSKVSGPTYMTVTTVTAGTGTGTGNIHLAPGFSDAGTAAATVRASDGIANSDRTVTVTVNNVDRPVSLAAINNMTVVAGSTADQTFTATDPDGDAITFTNTGPTFLTRTDNAQAGTTRTGNIHLAPSSTTSGTFSASVTASSLTSSDTKLFTITVTGVNNPPTLTQPSNMTVNEGQTADQTLTATDPDGNPLTFSKVSGPTYMTVTTVTAGTGTGTGSIHLAPGFSDAGTAAATVRASDGIANSDRTLTVTVNNVDRPVSLATINNMAVAAGSTADQTFTATDPDGDAITFTHTGPTFMTRTDNAQAGTTRTGNIHLAPVAGTSGTFSASVTASSLTSNDTKLFTITVTSVNNPPTLAQPSNMTVNEGQTADQTLTATDPDGNSLSFSKVSGPAYMTVTTVTAGTGTGTGNIHLAPGFSDAGTATATVRASDGIANSDRTLTITVNNTDRPPVLAAIANQTVTEGATADVGVSATDPDDDVITLTASLPSFATLTSSPAPGTVTGTIHIAPPFGSAGTYSASVTATANGATSTRSFTISVTGTNRAPTLAQPSNMTVNEGATQDQTLHATDPDGNALTFAKVSGPLFLTVSTTNATTGNAHLAPATGDRGTYSATVKATDTGGLSDQKSFSITVNAAANRPPVANPGGPYNGTVNVPVNFDGTHSSDPDGNPLTYAWDFGDGGTGTGATPSHAYAAEGTFTVSLTVTDNGTPPLSNTATTTATITNRLQAYVFQYPPNPLRLDKFKDKSKACFQIQPVNQDYNNSDVILASIVLQYNGREAPANIEKTAVNSDINGDGIQEIRACFSDASLRVVFAGLPSGFNRVTVALEGNLTTGGRFHGETEVIVRGPVGTASRRERASVSPNPLNPVSALSYVTETPGSVKVELFDIQGRLVRTIVNESFVAAGVHEAMIDGRGQRGEKLASGVYFVRGTTADGTFKNTITILK